MSNDVTSILEMTEEELAEFKAKASASLLEMIDAAYRRGVLKERKRCGNLCRTRAKEWGLQEETEQAALFAQARKAEAESCARQIDDGLEPPRPKVSLGPGMPFIAVRGEHKGWTGLLTAVPQLRGEINGRTVVIEPADVLLIAQT